MSTSKLDQGYKYHPQKNANIHVAKSRGCQIQSSSQRQGINLKILPYQISTGNSDRRVGGSSHFYHPIEQRDASPESQDLCIEHNQNTNLQI